LPIEEFQTASLKQRSANVKLQEAAENLGVEVTAGRTDLAVRQQLAQFHVF
jgi:hypothetical protein